MGKSYHNYAEYQKQIWWRQALFAAANPGHSADDSGIEDQIPQDQPTFFSSSRRFCTTATRTTPRQIFFS
jgi:hypothetical protein